MSRFSQTMSYDIKGIPPSSAEIEGNYSVISPVEDVKIITSNSVSREEPSFNEIIKRTSTATLGEQPNQGLLIQQRNKFTEELMSLILHEDFEYGIDTRADAFVRRYMALNAPTTKDWLGRIYIDNVSNIPVLIGLLRIVARLDYQEIKPPGQLIAIAALSHSNIEVQECGVRAFESWEAIDSLEILENLKVSTKWLQEYINEVVSDLKEEYNVFVHQEDYHTTFSVIKLCGKN